MTEALTIATAPWILSMVGGESAVTDYMWTVARIPNVTVRFVRGRKMMTLGALFDEFGAALQFPYYFGENMAAFSECISDLSWISGDAYVICIIDSELVLSESSNELMLFMKVMSRVAEG